MGLSALAGALWAGDAMRRSQDAASLAREAELVLSGPRQQTLELPSIEAARAVMLLEDALRIDDAAHIAGLLSHARAVDAYQKGKPERAAEHLDAARQSLGESADRRVLAAALASERGDLKAAGTELEKGLAADPKHVRLRLAAADLALDLEAPERASDLLRALIDEHPRMASLHNRLGLAHEAADRPDAALASFVRAAELDPSLHQPLVNVGRLRLTRGEYRAAEDAFNEAIGRAEADAEAWLGRGLCRRAQGDLQGGAIDIAKARELAPGEAGPLLAQADVDAQSGELKIAIDRYRGVLLLTPEDAVAWLKLGNALMRDGEPEAARSCFERSITLRPTLAAAHNGLGAALVGLGQHEEAAAMLLRASELDEQDPNPLLNLARLRRKQGDLRGAQQAEQAALALR